MTEDTRLAYEANHTYREGYDQGREDVVYEELELLEILADIATAQSLINRTVSRLNRFLNNNKKEQKGETE